MTEFVRESKDWKKKIEQFRFAHKPVTCLSFVQSHLLLTDCHGKEHLKIAMYISGCQMSLVKQATLVISVPDINGEKKKL